ncbi:hypothetical protein T03_9513 [Trichinella britovi]|uniref:Uncharacterized protein n=1 Tax=Trichinella britovi TaxID=45882 RepID=A0A0V1C4X7_TRIBR|nr:hypothetical protein T03_9513 [Trichinella britovi]
MLVNAECLITHIRWMFVLWFGFPRYLEATSKCYNSNGAAEADWAIVYKTAARNRG